MATSALFHVYARLFRFCIDLQRNAAFEIVTQLDPCNYSSQRGVEILSILCGVLRQTYLS